MSANFSVQVLDLTPLLCLSTVYKSSQLADLEGEPGCGTAAEVVLMEVGK